MKLGNCEILAAVEGIRGADVYEVELADSGRHMVVRIVSRAVPPLSAAAEQTERFLAEAAPFVALDHPNVLGLVDYGEQDSLRFMVDPYVGGPLLDYLVAQPLPLPVPVARRIIGEAAAGLQYLHDQGIVHGCVNVRTLYLAQYLAHPPSVGVGSSGQDAPAHAPPDAPPHVLVGDFGLHRFFEETAPANGQTFDEFLAPEQHHEPAQPASDQYALAVLAHLLLTGRLPVISSRSRPIEDISPGDLVPPSQLNPALPPAIDFLLNTALQPDPEQRFRQVRDLAMALDIATGVGPPPPPKPAPSPAAPAMPANRAPSMSAPIGPVASVPLVRVPEQAPADAIYMLPKAPPYTEPVRAVKAPSTGAKKSILPKLPKLPKLPMVKKQPRLPNTGGTRVSRRTVLLGLAGGAAGVAVVGGGYYAFTFFTHRGRGANAVADSVGLFRPQASSFLLLSTLTARIPDIVVPFGHAGDLPLAGDWNGDGVDTPGIFRPNEGTFYLAGSNATSTRVLHTVRFGQAGDLPLAGDWDGSGRSSIGVYRPSSGRFLLKRTLDPGPADIVIAFGQAGDLPLAGDWDGSGRSGVGVYRPSADRFLLLAHATAQSAPKPDYTVRLGVGQGLPLAGDWQRTGSSGVGLFVSATHTIYLKQRLTDSSAPEMHFTVGTASDLPVAGHWR